MYAYSGAGDFVAPLHELLKELQSGSEVNRRDSGYRLLLYLHQCQAGTRFPQGVEPLPEAQLPDIKRQLYECLFTRKGGTCLTSVNHFAIGGDGGGSVQSSSHFNGCYTYVQSPTPTSKRWCSLTRMRRSVCCSMPWRTPPSPTSRPCSARKCLTPWSP